MKSSWRTGIALVIGGILLGGTLSAVAQNDGSEATPEVPSSETVRFRGPGGHGGPGGPGKRFHHKFGLVTSTTVVEGEEEGTFNTIRDDAGVLQSVDGNTLVIERSDGEGVRVTTNDDTAIHRDREEAEVGDLKEGDHVFAHQVKEGDGDFVTKRVGAVSAERYAEMEAAREACTDDDESTECERPRMMRRGPRAAGGEGDVDPAEFPAPPSLEEDAA